MRAFFYAAILLSWETGLRAFAKPLATAEENLFTLLDYGGGGGDSLFSTPNDGISAGTGGNDMSFVTTGLDNSDLLIANDGDDASSCSSEVSLGDNVDDETLALGNLDDLLTSRDLDDNTLFADSETKTCISPGVGSSRKKKPDLHIPSLREASSGVVYDTGGDCHNDHPDRLCCGISNGMSPGDCDPWPIYIDCIHPRLEYCCISFDVIKRQGVSCVLTPTEMDRIKPRPGLYPSSWEDMHITLPDSPPGYRPPGSFKDK